MSAITIIFQNLTYTIDRAVYTCAKTAYDVFLFISDARLLSNTAAANLAKRVYAVLGIFMIFVLVYNLLMYIIDPDKMTDKENGMSAIIKNVIIALALILILPTAFNRLYTLQSMVINSGAIENIILGGFANEKPSNDIDTTPKATIDSGANILIANTYAAFLYPDEGNVTVIDCIPDNSSNNVPPEYCEAYEKVRQTGNIYYFEEFVGNDNYQFFPLATTVAGVVITFFMIGICFDIAKRAAKLAVLQLIAPVPLVLEIMPNKKGTRKGYFKELFDTYIQIFIYLAIIFLVVLLISFLPDVISGIINSTIKNANPEAGTVTQLFAILIISIALFQFGKEAPEYIFKLLGFESKGIIKAAGIRGVRTVGAGIAGLGTGVALGAGGVKDAIKTGRDSTLTGREKASAIAKSLGTGFAGAGIGAVRGTYAHRTGGFKGIRNDIKSTSAATSASFQSASDRIDRITGVFSGKGYERSNQLIAALDGVQSRTDYVKDDNRYSQYNDMYNKSRISSGYSEALTTYMSRTGNDEAKFVESIMNGSLSDLQKANSGWKNEDILNWKETAAAYQARDKRKDEVLSDKQGKIQSEAWKALEEIKYSKIINLSDSDNKELKDQYEKLRELFNDDGSLNASKFSDVNDSLEVGKEIDARFKELNNARKDRSKLESDRIISESVRRETRAKNDSDDKK